MKIGLLVAIWKSNTAVVWKFNMAASSISCFFQSFRSLVAFCELINKGFHTFKVYYSSSSEWLVLLYCFWLERKAQGLTNRLGVRTGHRGHPLSRNANIHLVNLLRILFVFNCKITKYYIKTYRVKYKTELRPRPSEKGTRSNHLAG